MYKINFSKQTIKDLIFIKRKGLDKKVSQILNIIKINPFQNPPPHKKLIGYENRYSRRINRQHKNNLRS